jgi:hypothetical protein
MWEMIEIGITGTRHLLTKEQKVWLEAEMTLLDLLVRLQKYELPILHHGDCVGADAYAHEVAKKLGWSVVVHPPTKQKYRANCRPVGEKGKILRPVTYLARNRAIVGITTILLGVPAWPLTEKDRVRDAAGDDWWWKGMSGTWYTVIEALEKGSEVRVCQPGKNRG